MAKNKKKTKSLPKLKGEAQILFNKWIRLRDEDQPCISCGKFCESYDAGHYYATQGYDGLRFNPDNCHKECVKCNRFDDSHLIGYGFNLEVKLGKKRYNELIQRARDYKQSGKKWSRSEIEDLIKEYKLKIKEL